MSATQSQLERTPARIGWRLLPVGSTLLALTAATLWVLGGKAQSIQVREPVAHQVAQPSIGPKVQRNTGTLILGPGVASSDTGSWPQFRGRRLDSIAADSGPLMREWPAEGLATLWRIEVGEGHAGVAIHKGRVYMIDYDREKQEDAIRCLSLADGKEIWRYTYYVKVKRNHGMSRTVPAANDDVVVTMGPLCHVTCLSAITGERLWKMDLVRQFGTTVPPWYAGQCPILDGDRVILAPGGDPLMMAVDAQTGRILWKAPNPGGWEMTHTSVTPMEFDGQRMYVYSSTRGVVGVSADDGRVLWTKTDWKIPIAAVASPVVVPPDRIFLSGGYDAGCLMVRLVREGSEIIAEDVFRRGPEIFGAPQYTPILYGGHLYGIIPSGELACMDTEGNRLWTSGTDHTFGLGPLLIADGLILALNDQKGTLHAAEASPAGYKEVASARVLFGHDAWAPMALVSGRLILRDLTQMACVEIGKE